MSSPSETVKCALPVVPVLSLAICLNAKIGKGSAGPGPRFTNEKGAILTRGSTP